LIKNFFATKYGYTPEQVEKLDLKTIEAFLTLENERNRQSEREQQKREHLSKQKNRGWK